MISSSLHNKLYCTPYLLTELLMNVPDHPHSARSNRTDLFHVCPSFLWSAMQSLDRVITTYSKSFFIL